MTKWYVKDLSKLTGISMQTLHHYDRIDLLKPSLRRPNGYRMYSEQDLSKLQKIIALKFFGLSLKQINPLLKNNTNTQQNLQDQVSVLEQKARSLLNISKMLKEIIPDVSNDKSIPWKTIVKLIEVYHMTEDLNNSWLKEIFTSEEINEYAEFLIYLKNNEDAWARHKTFQKEWAKLTSEVQNSLHIDPKSKEGIKIGERCMKITNNLYGKKIRTLSQQKI